MRSGSTRHRASSAATCRVIVASIAGSPLPRSWCKDSYQRQQRRVWCRCSWRGSTRMMPVAVGDRGEPGGVGELGRRLRAAVQQQQHRRPGAAAQPGRQVDVVGPPAQPGGALVEQPAAALGAAPARQGGHVHRRPVGPERLEIGHRRQLRQRFQAGQRPSTPGRRRRGRAASGRHAPHRSRSVEDGPGRVGGLLGGLGDRQRVVLGRVHLDAVRPGETGALHRPGPARRRPARPRRAAGAGAGVAQEVLVHQRAVVELHRGHGAGRAARRAGPGGRPRCRSARRRPSARRCRAGPAQQLDGGAGTSGSADQGNASTATSSPRSVQPGGERGRAGPPRRRGRGRRPGAGRNSPALTCRPPNASATASIGHEPVARVVDRPAGEELDLHHPQAVVGEHRAHALDVEPAATAAAGRRRAARSR